MSEQNSAQSKPVPLDCTLGAMRGIGGFMPTVFDMPDIWRLNSGRAGGKFNLLFGWWLTIITLPFFLGTTIMALCEWALMTPAQRKEHRERYGD
jgi:hypothetical protein